MKKNYNHLLKAGLALGILSAALIILNQQISKIPYDQIVGALHTLEHRQIIECLFATMISFSFLAIYDVYAARMIVGKKIPLVKAAMTGAAGNALSNTLGFHALTGGALRYRIYKGEGITAGDVARIFALASACIGFGYLGVATLSLLLANKGNGWSHEIGFALIIILSALLFWLSQKPRQLKIVNWVLVFPSRKTAAIQMLMGVAEMSAAIGGLYILLLGNSGFGFFDFSLLYISATLIGIISSVPGGVGVFEATMLAAFPAQAKVGLLAALLVYRLIYNLLPFALSVIAILAFETFRKSNQFERG